MSILSEIVNDYTIKDIKRELKKKFKNRKMVSLKEVIKIINSCRSE